ncbi:MAG TPA: TlpA disulfide reductase family protein [Acidimicrobiales bacterium]|nr:TlpA disulfide reductase family protein [Acidimicrobiales bacterium]
MTSTADATVATRGPRGTRRTVLWVSAGVGAVIAVLVAVLASSSPASQVTAQSPLVGRPAPAISGRVVGGTGSVTLSSFSGKWVLVNFAASWCVPCRQEMPQLLAFQRDHSSGDATILTVAYDDQDIPNLASFLKAQGATWPAVDDGSAVVDYGVGGLPESYLVDPAGTVIAKYVGGVNAAQLDAVIRSSTKL